MKFDLALIRLARTISQNIDKSGVPILRGPEETGTRQTGFLIRYLLQTDFQNSLTINAASVLDSLRN